MAPNAIAIVERNLGSDWANKITPENVVMMIRQMTRVKGTAPLSASYMRTILQAIIKRKREMGDNNWNFTRADRKKLYIPSPRKRIVLTGQLFSSMVDAAQYAILFKPNDVVAERRSWLDMLVSIMLLTSTNCTIPALHKMQIDDLNKLSISGTVNGITKTAYYDYLVDQIKFLINTRNNIYSEELKRSFPTDTSRTTLRDFVVTCSGAILNKKFQELLIQRSNAPLTDHNLGLSFFRKANFDELTRAIWTPTFITSLTELGRPVPSIHSVST